MKTYFYYKCLRKTIISFLDLFNDINVAKYDNDGNVISTKEVPIKLAPKEKFYSGINDRKHEYRLPMMGAQITGIEHSNERLSGKHENVFIAYNSEDNYQYYASPVPYDISFQVSIATEYIHEADQIAEQILSYFNPFVYTIVSIPEINDSGNVKVNFQSLSLDQLAEIDQASLRGVVGNYEFTAQSYLLKPVEEVKDVRKIVNKFYTSPESWAFHGSETESISGVGHQSEELLTIGYKDETDAIMVRYEVFTDESS